MRRFKETLSRAREKADSQERGTGTQTTKVNWWRVKGFVLSLSSFLHVLVRGTQHTSTTHTPQPCNDVLDMQLVHCVGLHWHMFDTLAQLRESVRATLVQTPSRQQKKKVVP